MKALYGYTIMGIGIIVSAVIFFHFHALNYTLHTKIQTELVRHPEKLPSSQSAKIGSFGFTNIVSDMYWLQTIQYIGKNAASGEYQKYLFVMMDLITDLTPFFEKPYTISLLLLPSSSERYEIFTGDEALGRFSQAEKIGEKGIKQFCDIEKIARIFQEDDLGKVITDTQYENPCESYQVPFYLAYLYFFYYKDSLKASQYYKVVSAQDDAPKGARIMAAIMKGRGGEREKSIHMFLSLARNTQGEETCQVLSQELQNAYQLISNSQQDIPGALLKNIDSIANEILLPYTEDNNSALENSECTNFLTKAMRELNLLYLESADQKYRQDNPNEISAYSPEKLFETGYIDYIPEDYQYEEGAEFGIIYLYDEESGGFDYKMGQK